MALSILWCGALVYSLFDSKTNRIILTGTSDEMDYWKNLIEVQEQVEANKKHFEKLREQYIEQLVGGGNTHAQAEEFLKSKMSFLFN